MEDIIEQLNKLGEGLYYKWGRDSYNERCQLYDIAIGLSDNVTFKKLKDAEDIKTTHEVFKDVLEELGFSDYKPNQMTNSDYWLCTCTAMERYAELSSKTKKVVKRKALLYSYSDDKNYEVWIDENTD